MAHMSVSIARNNCSSVARSWRRDLFELVVVYGLILLVIWTPRPWQTLLWCIAAASVMTITYTSFEGLEQMGLCSIDLSRSLWTVGAALALAVVAVALASKLHTLHMPGSPILFIQHYGGYAVWAFVQQIVLQCFFLSRLLRLTPHATYAVIVAAVLFAIAHLPSPILAAVTLIWGLGACLFFLRYRTLYPLAVAHAILGISIAITVPAQIIHNMRVGLGYLTYAPTQAPLAKP